MEGLVRLPTVPLLNLYPRTHPQRMPSSTQQHEQLPGSKTATGWPQNNAHKGMPQTMRTSVYMQCGGKGGRESTRPDYATYSAMQSRRSQSEPIMRKGWWWLQWERWSDETGEKWWEITKSTNMWPGGMTRTQIWGVIRSQSSSWNAVRLQMNCGCYNRNAICRSIVNSATG